MFGDKVTEFVQASVGEFGYILKLDITLLQATDVIAVQAQAKSDDTDSPSKNKMSLTSLQMLLKYPSNIDLAFCLLDNTCFVFFNSTKYPFADNTRFILDYIRGTNTAKSDTDNLDISNRFIGLVKLYALRDTYAIVKGQTPRNILDEIDREEVIVRAFV